MATTRREGRRRTEARLVKAVGTLIQREGVAALGVRAVAREAGVDKVLIYRYFDDFEGLLRFFATSADLWPSLHEVLHEPLAVYLGDFSDEATLLRGVLERYAQALERRPLTTLILAGAGQQGPLGSELVRVRQAWNEELVKALGAKGVFLLPASRALLGLFSLALQGLATGQRGILMGEGGGHEASFAAMEEAIRATLP